MIPFDLPAVLRSNTPVLCVDTCSFLDITRNPTRDDMLHIEHCAAMDLLNRVKSGDLVCLVAPIVEHEIRENAPNIDDEAKKGVQKLVTTVKKLDKLHELYGSRVNVDLSHIVDLLMYTQGARDEWFKFAQLLNQTVSMESNASRRVVQSVAPARKGKDSLKDCLVVETYVDAISQLRIAGHSSNIVFLSSNVSDFQDLKQTRPEFATELQTISTQYAHKWSLARHLLGMDP